MNAALDHKLLTEDRLRLLALAVARNRVGPDDPVEEVLAREGVTPEEFSNLLSDQVFTRHVKAFVTELTEKGFSFTAKCRVLAEDVVHELYHLARDADVPAAARVKAVENLVDWGGLAQKAAQTTAGGPGAYQLVINFNQTPEKFTGVTLEHSPHTTLGAISAAEAADTDLIDPDYA